MAITSFPEQNGGGAIKKEAIFNSSGNWVAPSNTNEAVVKIMGGGGAGGVTLGYNIPPFQVPNPASVNHSFNNPSPGGDSSAFGITAGHGVAGGNLVAKSNNPSSDSYGGYLVDKAPRSPGSGEGGGANGLNLRRRSGPSSGYVQDYDNQPGQVGQPGRYVVENVSVTAGQTYPIVVGSGGATGNNNPAPVQVPSDFLENSGGSGRVIIEYYE